MGIIVGHGMRVSNMPHLDRYGYDTVHKHGTGPGRRGLNSASAHARCVPCAAIGLVSAAFPHL